MKIVIENPKDLEKETKKRLQRLKREFKEPEIKLFPNTENYDQIIAQVDIPFMALCEHHLIAFEGKAYVGYIPNKWIIGLADITEIITYFLNPTVKTIQEKATHQIINYFKKAVKPKGVMVVLKAKHGCVWYHKTKKPSWTITSAIYGTFRKDPSVKQEFLNIIKL